VSTPTPLEEAAATFQRLAELIYKGESFEGIYAAIVETACDVVPGCDRACVTTMRAGSPPVCEAATDEIARRVDDLERETGEGPCLDAILSQRFEFDPDISHESAWPNLARRVLAETPVRGMLGFRILVGERKAGALNLFADAPGQLTDESAGIGAIVAAFASVALAASAHLEDAATLRQALGSNREIGKAVGLLMATHGVSDDAAFDQLRDASSRLNVRLAEVARRLVDKHNDDVQPGVG